MDKYRCSICGYIYNPKDGDKDGGIVQNTLFQDLSADWTCPVCRNYKSVFVKIENTSSNNTNNNSAPQNNMHIEEQVNISDYDGNSE